MSSNDHHHRPHLPEGLSAREAEADVLAAVGATPRVLDLLLIVFVVVLVCPPLITLVAVLAMAALAFAAVGAVLAAALGVIALPFYAVRFVLRHHSVHGATVVIHHLRWPALARSTAR